MQLNFVVSNVFFKTTRSIELKLHMEHPWDKVVYSETTLFLVYLFISVVVAFSFFKRCHNSEMAAPFFLIDTSNVR